jgi:hypothetical protein
LVWEAIFMLVVLKIPVVYLAVVVWWAVRAESTPGPGGEAARVFAPLAPCGWDEWRRRAWTRSAALRPRPRPRCPGVAARPRRVAE